MSDRRVLVTGASRGLGRAVAFALADRGWSVTVMSRDEHAADRTRSQLPGDGHRALALDVTDDLGWERIAPELEVQGLVCAAAVIDPIGPIGSYSVADFRRTLDVNIAGTVLAIRACLPALCQREGAIVTFSGGGATAPLPRFDAYAASKAAIARLTENMSADLADVGVRINCVAPGFVATDIHSATLAAGPELAGEAYYERTLRQLEDGGVPPGEAAELVCLLLEENPSSRFTGKLLSAQWDPWRDPSFQRKLADHRDLGTLRRVDDMLFTAVSGQEA